MHRRSPFFLGASFALLLGCGSAAEEPVETPATAPAEQAQTVVGAAIEPAVAAAMVAPRDKTLARPEDDDLASAMRAIHAASGHERGLQIARYMSAADRLSPEARAIAVTRLAKSFE